MLNNEGPVETQDFFVYVKKPSLRGMIPPTAGDCRSNLSATKDEWAHGFVADRLLRCATLTHVTPRNDD
jgi:hypothetical protein